MKKLFFILLLGVLCTLNSFGQFKITNDNKIGIGTAPDNNYAITMKGDVYMKGDNNNYIRLLATAGSGGPFVDISPSSNYYGYSYLGYYERWSSAFIKYLYVYNDLSLYGTFYNYSDSNLKKNINPISYNKELFKLLKPVNYNMVDSIELTNKNGETSVQKFDNKQFPIKGFIAQDVQKIYPELVEEDTITGLLKIKTLELIPILVKAIQSQQEEIDALKEEIATFSSQLSKVRSNPSDLTENGISSAVLYQNNPNTFSQSTQIPYYLPDNNQSATILIYDLNGNQLKSYPISQKGYGHIIIQASELSAGIYLYTLIANGKAIETKQMILTK